MSQTLTIVCYKCTRELYLLGDMLDAAQQGWKCERWKDTDRLVCPHCQRNPTGSRNK